MRDENLLLGKKQSTFFVRFYQYFVKRSNIFLLDFEIVTVLNSFIQFAAKSFVERDMHLRSIKFRNGNYRILRNSSTGSRRFELIVVHAEIVVHVLLFSTHVLYGGVQI